MSVTELAEGTGFGGPPPGPPRPPIRVLPSGVAARIAAGETIERPASVVKELVENAIDAGAANVQIDIRGGGLGLIRVGDDGCGIRAADLWLACQRHATSKYPAAGLGAVQTLGFRGEALPAIAAVGELTIVSAADATGVGWKLSLRDGDVAADEPAPRPRGTTVSVRRLFEKLPARLAAMRPPTELAQIAQTVRRLALAAPAIRLALHVDDKRVLATSGSGDLAICLGEVLGGALTEALLPLGPVEAGRTRAWGVIAGPETTRAGRSGVHLSVNGRAAAARGLLATLEAAWRPVLPRGRHPILALAIEAAPERVDVNIHPAKEEVRLRDEQALGQALGVAVRETLGRLPIPLAAPPLTGVAALAREAGLAEASPAFDGEGPIETPGLPPLRLVGQLRGRLVLLEGDDGLYLVDQHRAHERVLYQRLRAADGGAARALTDPLLLELRSHQAARFAARLRDLAAVGFEVESFGGRTFLLRGAPSLPGVLGDEGDAMAGLGAPDELLRGLLALADDPAGDGEGWRERLLVSLACRSAVRRGVGLGRPAMRALIAALGQTEAPAVCPHGSPLLMRVGADLLERQFGW